MRLKPRTALVISLSSAIITSVMALTIFGFYAYLEWRTKNIKHTYQLARYELDAEIFKNDIHLDMDVRAGGSSLLRPRTVAFGTIKNNSSKVIYSIQLKIAFYDKNHTALYVETFYPIGSEPEVLVNFGDIVRSTKKFLGAGDSISFTHQLKNCPKEVMDYLNDKSKFAKSEGEAPISFVYKIEGIDLQ